METNAIDARLGPCPWCQDRMRMRLSEAHFYVECDNRNCMALGPSRPTPTAAADAWLSVFPRLGLPVDPPEGFVRVRLVVWTDYTDAIDAALEHNTCAPADSIARASTIVADVPLQTVFPVVGVTL